jgi:hypothetical protein
MRPLPEMIRLGVREWQVRPLTLRQVQEIEPILLANATETKGNVAAAIAIVAIALRRDHADAVASLGEIEATAPEIGAAMATVLRLGGFIETAAHGGLSRGNSRRATSLQRIRPRRFWLYLRKAHDLLRLHPHGDR